MGDGSEAKLYVILGSHACRTGMLLLEHKGIPYRKVTLPTGLQPTALRLLGFSGNRVPFRTLDRRNRLLEAADRGGTVPPLAMNGHRVKRNRRIARFLDEVQPDPPLFPADPDDRREVEEAERWGDEVLQMAARRLTLAAALHGRDALFDRGGDGRLGPLLWRHDLVRLVGARLTGRFVFEVNERSEAELLASLPQMLDRVDGWIEAGLLNGEELNAADYMIVPSLALLCYRRDLRPEVERRRAAVLVDRLLPNPVGRPSQARSPNRQARRWRSRRGRRRHLTHGK